jgi:hypothetical protein
LRRRRTVRQTPRAALDRCGCPALAAPAPAAETAPAPAPEAAGVHGGTNEIAAAKALEVIRDNAGDASMPGTKPAQRPAGPHGVGDSTEAEVVPPVVEDGSSLSPEPQAGAARVVDGQIVRG